MILCDITLYRSKAEIPQKSHPVNMLLINKSLEVHATNKIKKRPCCKCWCMFLQECKFYFIFVMFQRNPGFAMVSTIYPHIFRNAHSQYLIIYLENQLSVCVSMMKIILPNEYLKCDIILYRSITETPNLQSVKESC